MTYEEKVQFFRRYQQSLRQERELEQELLTLRSQACRVTPLLSALPSGTPDGQGIPLAVERIIQAQQELERQIAICADTRRDIIAIINQITDARDQEILRRRYLLGQRFEQIAVEMHLGQEEAQAGNRNYLHNVTKKASSCQLRACLCDYSARLSGSGSSTSMQKAFRPN